MKSIIDLMFILFSFVFIGNGCEQTTPSTQKPTVQSIFTNSYFPLDSGDYWVYSAIGSTGDSVKRNEITGTKQIGGNSYYIMTEKYYGKHPASWDDTLYLRFIDSNTLVRYISGKDSAYINFSLPIIPGQQGQRYPGVVNAYPYSDSISIGRYDSLKYIIFRGFEPIWSEYAKNIGEIESDFLIPKSLKRAKVNSIIYP